MLGRSVRLSSGSDAEPLLVQVLDWILVFVLDLLCGMMAIDKGNILLVPAEPDLSERVEYFADPTAPVAVVTGIEPIAATETARVQIIKQGVLLRTGLDSVLCEGWGTR